MITTATTTACDLELGTLVEYLLGDPLPQADMVWRHISQHCPRCVGRLRDIKHLLNFSLGSQLRA